MDLMDRRSLKLFYRLKYLKFSLNAKDKYRDISCFKNIDILLEYIGRHNSHYGHHRMMSNAYDAILEKTDKYLNIRWRNRLNLCAISKREISKIRNYHTTKIGGKKKLYIPYRAFIIFKAIIELVCEAKAKENLPDDLRHIYNKFYRDSLFFVHYDFFLGREPVIQEERNTLNDNHLKAKGIDLLKATFDAEASPLFERVNQERCYNVKKI